MELMDRISQRMISSESLVYWESSALPAWPRYQLSELGIGTEVLVVEIRIHAVTYVIFF